MSQEWISQSKAIKEFKINIYDLHSNIGKIVDCTKSKKFEQIPEESKIKIAKNPLFPLTLRLTDNPRGYETPMRLYKISQIKELQSLLNKFSEIHTPSKNKIVKKQIKKKIKNIKITDLKIIKDSCEISGHEFHQISDNQEICKRCNFIIESETI